MAYPINTRAAQKIELARQGERGSVHSPTKILHHDVLPSVYQIQSKVHLPTVCAFAMTAKAESHSLVGRTGVLFPNL